MVRRTVLIGGISLMIGAGSWPPGATARPLESAVCAGLDKEKTALETAGVAADLHLNPDEAKALAADKLQRVQRYVQISADVLFRCPISVTITPVAAPAADTGAGTKPAKVADTATSKATPDKKPISAAKARPAAKSAKPKR